MASELTPAPRICIMGCGRVGAQLAEMFDAEHYAVHVIDRNTDAFDRLTKPYLREQAVLGDGTDPMTLRLAKIEGATVFIAVTNGDNRNIMATQIAKITFKVPVVLCRIYDPRRHEIYRESLNSFCPTLIGAEKIHDAIAAALQKAPLSRKS